MIVQKYGGTSVGSAARIRRAARRVAAAVSAGEQVVVVVSAMGKTTDQLISLARRLCSAPPVREMDMLVSNGETITAPLLAMSLCEMGIPATSLSGLQAGVRTNRQHSQARIVKLNPERLHRLLRSGVVPVVAGFQGVSDQMEVTTLGRGGSDTTAVALAAAVGASACEIYTDVEGVLTADPRLVPEARLISQISYEECLEMASLGAKVIHPRAVELGELYGLPIHVRSSASRRPGTMILSEADIDMEERKRVRGLAHEYGVAKVTVKGVPEAQPGIAAAILEPLSAAGISVDVIVQNIPTDRGIDFSFTCSEEDLSRIEPLVCKAATDLGAGEVLLAPGGAKVSIIGTGMVGTPGIASSMFRVLADAGINIQMITTAEIRITCLINGDEVKKAVQALHAAFRLEEEGSYQAGPQAVALCP